MKKSKTSKRTAGQRLRAAHGSVRCPSCNGTGKISKENMRQTKYVWTALGAKKQPKNKKWNKATSFLTITTFTAPNQGEPNAK